jgi:glutathionylspermidine synthase
MKRLRFTPRPDWEKTVADQGVSFARVDGRPYWDESVAYEFTAAEVDQLEAATNELHARYLDAGQAVIDRGWYAKLGLSPLAIPLIEATWSADAPSLYGRFDLAYDGRGTPKLLEYNADTPTALVEAAVAQWFWLKDCCPGCDQFNSIHERLIAGWGDYRKKTGANRIHLCALRESLEDNQTILYLEDTIGHAGLTGTRLAVEDIGWDGSRFVDLQRDEIRTLFKLYPWEWLLADQFGSHLASVTTVFVEPAWKMMFSSKGMLPLLWEMFPGHPNLLPAFFSESPELGGNYIRKPLLSREGRNIEMFSGGRSVAQTEGPYGAEGFVFQAVAPRLDFEGQYPIVGSWVVGGEAAGMGLREDTAMISTNESRFVPHFFRD